MGQNRRYPEHTLGREIEESLARPRPISLTEVELRPDIDPVRTGAVVPVEAWVRYPETPVRTRCEAFEWTDRAVHIRWTDRHGRGLDTWVWASAIVSRPRRRDRKTTSPFVRKKLIWTHEGF
ncbi:hypothetical protein SAMN06295924_11624 [Rathayibacter rathayi NCPPB 2980 = VKM Ac-1601]|uniref:hypothetical protein n=1 Tax=Rathayibacter rathayi TaxID=33887 RepID=UPI000BD9CE09|nr:hypothetical protein [Rathayibacter rathayi]TWD63633.1 hypothetical protein FB469_3106 [Rathayibacter rathayi]SOE05861.1 hypothetical protein SAMN06295924_11624 [Rathayibacter rathayi NCPPB 2980 = VKM Ac-1601]